MNRYTKNTLFNDTLKTQMSDDDEWVNSGEYKELYEWMKNETIPSNETTPPIAPRPAVKQPVQSTRTSDQDRILDFCIDYSAGRVLTSLEDNDFYKNAAGLVALANFLFTNDNRGNAVWKAFKPYHANLLAYQLAAGIRNGTITDVGMVSGCYRIIVNVFENSIPDNPDMYKHYQKVVTKGVYIQWVSKETPDEMGNLTLIFRFLMEKDTGKQYYAVGKLPKE